MPRATYHDEIGVIVREGNELVLIRDDGGRWRLDTHYDALTLTGRRTRVTGIRAGFDLLDVTTIVAV